MTARCKTRNVLATGLGVAMAAIAWSGPAGAQWAGPVYGDVAWGYGNYVVHRPVAPGFAFLERPKGGLVITHPPYIRQFVWHPVAVRRPVPIWRPPSERWR
jgi:hypothetical protein